MSIAPSSTPQREVDPRSPTAVVSRSLELVPEPVRKGPAPGDVIADRYELRDRLAAGGLGVVFRAIHRETGRVVAVKLLHERYREDASWIERTAREARFACAVRHPSIVEILDAGRSAEGHAYITMEYLDGRTLRTVLRDSTFVSPQEAVEIMLPIVEAVEAAHAVGVVHRDLKPENVIVVDGTGGRSIKVLDFGVAGAVAEPNSDDRLTTAGTVLGTHPYMSPEQAIGATPEPSFDVFALGVMLHELLTGVLPFGSDPSRSLAAKFRGVVDPQAYDRADVPELWRALVARCVAVDPDERPTAAELGAALAALARTSRRSIVRRVGGRVRRGAMFGGVTTAVASLVVGVWLGVAKTTAAPPVVSSTPVAMPAVAVAAEEPAHELAPQPIAPDVVELDATTVRAPEPVDADDVRTQPRAPKSKRRVLPPPPSVTEVAAPIADEPAVASVDCDAIRSTLQDARDAHRWRDVLAAADVQQCWSAEAHTQWRTKALMELGRFDACAAEGRDAAAAQVRSWASLCEQRAAKATPTEP